MEPEAALAGQLRAALRRTAQTVAVVSIGGPEGRRAMSATAVAPVSMDPPAMLFCVNRRASSFPLFERGYGFCVNFLTAEHRKLAAECAGGLFGEARFAGGAFETDANGVPYLPTALASIFCVQDGRHLYGTHAVIIGKVKEVRLGDKRAPLLYYDAGFRTALGLDTPAPEQYPETALEGGDDPG